MDACRVPLHSALLIGKRPAHLTLPIGADGHRHTLRMVEHSAVGTMSSDMIRKHLVNPLLLSMLSA